MAHPKPSAKNDAGELGKFTNLLDRRLTVPRDRAMAGTNCEKVQLFPPGGVDGCDHELITKNPNDAPGGEMPEIAFGGWCEKSARTCDALGGLGG